MNNWEREIEIIESLGKLYPRFNGNIFEYNYNLDYDYDKAWWVCSLCKYHLNCRIPRLEAFIKENNRGAWKYYKEHFNIKE